MPRFPKLLIHCILALNSQLSFDFCFIGAVLEASMHTFSIRTALASAFQIPLRPGPACLRASSTPQSISPRRKPNAATSPTLHLRAPFSTSISLAASKGKKGKGGPKPDRRISQSSPPTRYRIHASLLTTFSSDPPFPQPPRNTNAPPSALLSQPFPPALDDPPRLVALHFPTPPTTRPRARKAV